MCGECKVFNLLGRVCVGYSEFMSHSECSYGKDRWSREESEVDNREMR